MVRHALERAFAEHPPGAVARVQRFHTHRRALSAGVKRHGATVHFVVPETDSGPIIVQEWVPVVEGDSEETLAARVLEVEHRIYPQALRLVAEGRTSFDDPDGTAKNAP